MSIIFNSVTQYEIQPERTKRRVKRDDLDTLSEIWTGPSDQEDTFVPLIGSVHPQYNLMTVIDTSIKRLPACVSEVTIDYQGKLDSSGSSNYTSGPTISQSWAEGEVSYQENSSIGMTIAQPGGGFSTLTQTGVATYSHRYTGRGAQIAYITNRRPTGNPTNIGLSKDFLGFTNEWDVFSGFQPGAKIEGGGAPIQQITCTDVKIEDRADGWYRVTETYQSRMFPQATIAAPSSGAIAVRTAQPSSAQTGATNSANLQTYGAAQAAAIEAGLPLPSGSGNLSDVLAATGIDPSWGSVYQAVTAASGGTDYVPPDMATASVSESFTTPGRTNSMALDY
jgi:hypothetical protein